MVVIAIIGILALIAAPSYLDQMIRKQIVDARAPGGHRKDTGGGRVGPRACLPPRQRRAGLPAADKIVNNYISSLSIEEGAIHIVFGNSANSAIKGRILSIRPAVVARRAGRPGRLGVRQRRRSGAR